MKATIYHNPNCSTSRKALARLRDVGADVTVIEYLKTPPTQGELARLYQQAGLTPREGLRMKETRAKELVAEGASDDAILAAMAAEPVLIERPIVVTEKGVRLARPLEKLEEIL